MHTKLKKGRLSLYIILLIIIASLMFCLRQCSATRPHVAADSRPGGDTVNIGIEYSPLAVMSMGGDSLGGFGYELMSALAKNEGLTVNFHPVVRLEKALQLLDSGYFDVVIAELPMTAEFRERYRFTEPVFVDRQVLVQLRDSAGNVPVNSQLDLGGHTVTLVAGSPAADRIANLSREIGDTILIDTDSIHSPEQLFLLTAAGEIPMAVINASTARAMATDYPDVDISKAVSFSQLQSWVLTRRNKVLSDTIDAALHRFTGTAAYQTLLKRYGLTAPSR